MKVKLNQKYIDKKLICPDGRKQIEFVDTELPGLYVLVSSVSPGIGTYYVRYKNEVGKTCHKKIARTDIMSLKDARDHAKVLKLEIAQGKDPQADTKKKRNEMTYSEFMEEHYLPYVSARLRSAKGYKQMYHTHLKQAFGEMRVSQITRRQVQMFHDELRAQGLANATCNRYLALIKSSFNTGIKIMEVIDTRNPGEGLKMYDEVGRVRFLSEEELTRLLPMLIDDGGPISKIIRFLLATGLRLSEGLNARWSEIDLNNRVLVIPATRSKSKKTDSIPLNDTAIQVLEECDKSLPYPFANPNTKKPYVSIKKGFKKLMDRAEIENFRIHDLRHSCASVLINAGGSLYEVQAILRHSSSQVTEKYAHLSKQTVMAASDTISDQLMRAAGNQ